jgi:hypothetical protein
MKVRHGSKLDFTNWNWWFSPDKLSTYPMLIITNDNPLPPKQKSKKRIKVTNHINHKPKINKQKHIKNLNKQKIQSPESGLTRTLQITKHTKHPRKN